MLIVDEETTLTRFYTIAITIAIPISSALPNYTATANIRREFLKDNMPAATGVIVNRLLRPSMLIEVDVIAVLG